MAVTVLVDREDGLAASTSPAGVAPLAVGPGRDAEVGAAAATAVLPGVAVVAGPARPISLVELGAATPKIAARSCWSTRSYWNERCST